MRKGTDLTVEDRSFARPTMRALRLCHTDTELYRCICCAARARPPKKAQMTTEKKSDFKEYCQASTSTCKTLQSEVPQFSQQIFGL